MIEIVFLEAYSRETGMDENAIAENSINGRLNEIVVIKKNIYLSKPG